MIRWIRSWLTTERHECLFVDVVSGKEVFRYTDCYGDEYMAEWSPYFFRVKMVKRGAT